MDPTALGLVVVPAQNSGGLQSPEDAVRWGVRDETRRIALRLLDAPSDLVQAESWGDDRPFTALLASDVTPAVCGVITVFGCANNR